MMRSRAFNPRIAIEGAVNPPRGLLRVTSPGREVYLLGTVTGLASEAARVRAAFDEVGPDAVGIGLPPSEVAGLRHCLSGGSAPVDEEEEEEDVEEAYSVALSSFGDVGVPPPDLMEAVRLAEERELEIFPVDLDDEAYAQAFTEEVSGLQLIRYGLRLRRLGKRPPRAGNAVDFALKWDGEIRRIRGFHRLEQRRERRMADAVREIPARFSRVLAIVEVVRMVGVASLLSPRPLSAKDIATIVAP